MLSLSNGTLSSAPTNCWCLAANKNQNATKQNPPQNNVNDNGKSPLLLTVEITPPKVLITVLMQLNADRNSDSKYDLLICF